MRALKFSGNNEVVLLHGGVEFFPALIEACAAAQNEIYLETYIFAHDPSGDGIKTALAQAAARGVKVHVLTDWTGTGRTHSALLKSELKEAGVEHRNFNPWFWRGVARNHRKLCVIDRRVAFIGGINIIDDMYTDDDTRALLPHARWDFAVRIKGPLVAEMQAEAEEQWLRVGPMKLRSRIELLRRAKKPKGAMDPRAVRAALVVRDNFRNRRTIQKAYLQAIGHAQQSVLIANPYFAPGHKLRRALEQAVSRGVDVTLLLGVGQFKLQDAVAHSFYPKLLEAGVKLVEYRHTQLHAKVAVVDGDWATVGSSNIDGLSLFLNKEANVVIRDVQFAKALRAHIEQDVAQGVVVDRAEYADIPWLKRVWYGAAFLLYQTIIRVVTWSKYV
ncbi:MAG TPA: cardiolipin synthase ClsB [Burkholderiaceae bacterium]